MQSSKSKERLKKYYFDNNATTRLHKETKKICKSWLNAGNASSIKALPGRAAHDVIEEAREVIRRHIFGRQPHTPRDKGKTNTPKRSADGKILITSGASEANAAILECVAISSIKHCNRPNKRCPPVIIISSIEHKCIILKCQQLQDVGIIKVEQVPAQPDGIVSPFVIEDAIGRHKAANHLVLLVSVMHANNETGAINDIKSIGRICKQMKVPFHSDVTQTFGKFVINPIEYNLDAFSMSFHKMHGAKGAGMLYVRDTIELYPLINSMQQLQLRGGTENVAAISTIAPSIRQTFKDRDKKNDKMQQLVKYIIKKLIKYNIRFTLLGPSNFAARLPNTLLISFSPPIESSSSLSQAAARRYRTFCNTTLMEFLDKKGITVSIGSACNTSSKFASHVLKAMNVPKEVFRGVLRISLSEFTTHDECKYLARALRDGVNEQLNH